MMTKKQYKIRYCAVNGNLIDVIDSRTVLCEAYMFSVESKEKCDMFLSSKCKDKRKIKKNLKQGFVLGLLDCLATFALAFDVYYFVVYMI